jgi:hypothetical protein
VKCIKYCTMILVFLSMRIFAQTDPNNDASWNWNASTSFILYHNDFPTGNSISVTSPFYQNIEALRDNEKTDGWELVMRDFGTPTRHIAVPFFVLYNRYQGILRIFVFTRMPGSYSDGGIELFFGSTSKTAVLTYLKNRAYAVDKSSIVGSNRSIASTPIIHSNWAYAEFPMAFDFNTSSIQNPSLWFKIWGLIDFNINLQAAGDLRQTFGDNKPASIPSESPLTVNAVFDAASKGAISANESWNNWKGRVSWLGNRISGSHPNSSVRNIRTSILGLSSSWLANNITGVGAAIGLVDYFVAGGKKVKVENPSPMNFLMNLSLSGTMKAQHLVSGIVKVPLSGANHTVWDVPTNLLYNQPLGILNLRKTPILQSRSYWQQISANQSQLYTSYRIKENIELDLNPNAGLTIQTAEAAIVYHLNNASYDEKFLQWADEGKVILESAHENKYVFRTPYVNARDFQYQTANVSPLTDVTIKIKVVLTRNDAQSGTQPIIYIATFEPDFENGDGVVAEWPKPAPTKPQNVTSGRYNDANGESRPQLFWYWNGEPDVATGGGYKVWRRIFDRSLNKWSSWMNIATLSSISISYIDYGVQGAGWGPERVEYKLQAYNSSGVVSAFSDIIAMNFGPPVSKKGGLFTSEDVFENKLDGNYPNPFNPITTISYSIQKSEYISLKVYDLMGVEVAVLEDNIKKAGKYTHNFDGSKLASGVYIYKLTTGSYSEVKKMLLLK